MMSVEQSEQSFEHVSELAEPPKRISPKIKTLSKKKDTSTAQVPQEVSFAEGLVKLGSAGRNSI